MDKYILRQAILRVMKERIHPGAARLELIAMVPDLVVRSIDREQLLETLQGLADHGYLQNLRPGRAPAYKLTAKGIDQVDQETDLDEYIWGDIAL